MLTFSVLAGGDGEEIDGALAREFVGQDIANQIEAQGVLGGLRKRGFREGGNFLFNTIDEHLFTTCGDALVEKWTIDVEVDAANPGDILRIESSAQFTGGFASEDADFECADDAVRIVDVDGIGADRI